MIDRSDMLELTRRMNAARSCFDRIAGAYLDGSGEIEDTFNVNFLKLSAADRTKNLSLAKTIPFSRTNDQLKEYSFQAGGQGSFHQLLLGLRDSALKNDALTEVFYELTAEKVRLSGDWYIFLFHGVYDIPVKGKDKAFQGESEEVYDFVICAVGSLAGEYEPGPPSFGFLFPAFSDRSADPGKIDVYSRSPEDPALLFMVKPVLPTDRSDRKE